MPFPRIRIPGIPTQQKRPEFPSTDDLCNLSLDDAKRALAALRVLVDADLADVYSSAGSDDTRWNVWSNIQWKRTPLPEWAAQWVEAWHQNIPPDDGGTAA